MTEMGMANGKGIIAAGAGLLWRRQRVLWWLFGMNLATGIVATVPVRSQLRVLDGSIAASDSLYHQMNLFRLIEAVARPEGLPGAFFGGSVVLVAAYFFFLLFAMGGVLESFYSDRTLTFGEFLRASADFFWRMVRLLIIFGVLIVPLAIAQSSVSPLTKWLSNHSDSEQLGFWVTLGVGVVLALFGLAVRVWVDVAQLDAVAQDQPAVRRSMRRARLFLRGHFGRLYGAVLAVQLLLFGISLLLLLLWIKLPHEAIGLTFLIGEVIVLLWLGFRLWQKAVETAWYQQRVLAEMQPMVAAPPVSDASPIISAEVLGD
jgi:hypothetical protein